MMKNDETIGQKVSHLMKAAGLNQTTLAAKSGVDRPKLNKIILGKLQPTPDEIVWIGQALGVDQDVLGPPPELPPRAVKRGKEAIERVLRAEGERDEAVARTKVLEDELKRVRDEQRHDREAAEEAMRQASERAQADMRKRRTDGAVEKKKLTDRIAFLEAALAVSETNNSLKASTIAQLRQQVESIRARKATSEIAVGLAGLLIGHASAR